MATRLLTAAAALLAPAVDGLAAQAFLGTAAVEPDPQAEATGALQDGMRSWLERAEKANEGLDEELRTVMSELADTARKEKDPRTSKERQLQMLEDLLKEYDTENETNIDETSKRMAAIAFRKAIRNHIRKPNRKSGKAHSNPSDAVDSKMTDEFSTWVQEATRATHDLEKQMSTEESDLGLPKPKGAEEKILDRVADLIDEVDPKNASEMADLGEALAQKRKPKRKDARHAFHESAEQDAQMVEAMRAWVLEANKASRELEKSVSSEESDLGDAKPKGEEEKNLARVADLIDEVDPKNASEMADLADALAQVHRWPKRKAARHASQDMSEADSTMVEAIKTWMGEANKASQDFEKDARHEESDLGDAKPKGEEEKSLERVSDLIDEVDPKNASEMADLADALAQVARRPKRRAVGRSHRAASATAADTEMVEAMRSWMAEANKASQDFEKDARHEESDLGDAKPKGEEEKNLARVADLIDEVDPKNASEMADLADALAQVQRWPKRKAARHAIQDMAEADSTIVEAMRSWIAEANKASQDLEKDARHEESDLGDAKPKGEEEKSLERVADLIDEVNPKNASEIADLADALAQVKRPKRKAVHHEMSELDVKVAEAMKNWMAEATKESQDMEKDASHDDSDLGLSKPKGEEEKNLDRVADLIDEVDPKNASEMADLGEALNGKARTLDGKLKPRSETTEHAEPMSSPDEHEDVKSWMAEADQATSEIDEEIDEAIDELIAGPKSEEERELERIQRLIDSTDPENATDVADLAASLATSSSFTRRVVQFPDDWKGTDRTEKVDWTHEKAKKFWSWLKNAEADSEILDRDLESSEAEFQEYLQNMTSAQQAVMHTGLKVLEEMWEKYDFDNESATAEDVMERVQLHRVRRAQ